MPQCNGRGATDPRGAAGVGARIFRKRRHPWQPAHHGSDERVVAGAIRGRPFRDRAADHGQRFFP